jgi:NADPH2:quinone reductase
MRAAFYDRKGPPGDVLRLGELVDPEPGPGEVRIRVQVSAVNPSDTKGRGGWDGNIEMPAPRIVPHQDGAGIIDRAGLGVPPARVGERVWIYEAQRDGRAFGTAAEYVVVPARHAVPLPAGIGLDHGACLGIPGMTAHRCLFMDGPIQGQTVLVAGGGGAVGNAAIQLAAWAGARVIATVSRPEQEQAARSAGAHAVVNRKRGDLAERIKEAALGAGVDRIVEVAFEENLELDRAVLKTNGVIASYSSGPAQSQPRIPFRAVMARGFSFHFVLVYVMPEAAHLKAAQDINACLAAGRYQPQIGKRFPLAQIAQAHVAQEGGQVVGKIVVDME